MNYNNPTTQIHSVLYTPEGNVDYWVQPIWQNYKEIHTTNGSAILAQIAVPWHKRELFRRYALGFTKGTMDAKSLYGTADITRKILDRVTPLKYPFAGHRKFLVKLESIAQVTGVHPVAGTTPKGPLAIDGDGTEARRGWFTFPDETGMPARINYIGTFVTLPYSIIPQDKMVDQEGGDTFENYFEQARYVTIKIQSFTRLREIDAYIFELETGTSIAQAGFKEFVEYEIIMTWHAVPWQYIPWAAIAKCSGKINYREFGYCREYTKIGEDLPSKDYGKYRRGTVRFLGPSGDMVPYMSPSDEIVTDIPYRFHYRPADGLEDSQLKLLTIDNTWKKIRRRGVTPAQYPLKYEEFDPLFEPETADCFNSLIGEG